MIPTTPLGSSSSPDADAPLRRPRLDAGALTEELNLAGVRILTGHRVLSVEEGYVEVGNRLTREVVDIPGRAVLMAIGHQRVIDTEVCARLGVEHSERGIDVDERLRTNVPNIWAIGDATG